MRSDPSLVTINTGGESEEINKIGGLGVGAVVARSRKALVSLGELREKMRAYHRLFVVLREGVGSY